MKYVPISGGSRALKNKFTCQVYCKSESIHLLWSSHKGTFTKGAESSSQGLHKYFQSCPPKTKLGGSRKSTKKMNKTEEHKLLNVNVYNISKMI